MTSRLPSDGATVADNEDPGLDVLVGESLVTNLFKIFHSLIPANDGATDFATLVRMKNDFVDKYSKHQFRKVTQIRKGFWKYRAKLYGYDRVGLRNLT